MLSRSRSVADDSHHQNNNNNNNNNDDVLDNIYGDNDDNKSFRIKHDDVSFFSRLLSRQQATTPAAAANTHSFRVYYADDDVSVPFVWESQPGTPKHRFASGGGENVLRPSLTPPPSFFTGRHLQVKKRSSLLRALLVKLKGLKKGGGRGRQSSPPAAAAASPSYSSSSSSSTRSWFSAAAATISTPPSSSRGRRRRQVSSSGSGCSIENGIIIEEAISGEVSPAGCWGISNGRALSMH
ncbi:hypothetical protein DM860_002765 [Cuscuta australis]|uniref:Uncharacterized protein n=1 Tax=Cuscuta australis TaxID=267555 RepID=A0A328D0G1_9ASTE|nr:hypothetical protein DM860_002765 [Cuscuta australis]